MSKMLWGLLVGFILVATGCGGSSDDGVSATTNDLRYRTFESTSVDGHVINPGSTINLAFERETLTTRAGCGEQWGKFAVKDGFLRRGFESQSGFTCSINKDRQSKWLVNYLREGAEARVDDGRLTLTNGDGVSIELDETGKTPGDRVDDGFSDTTWTLASLTDPHGKLVDVPHGIERPTLTFSSGNAVSFDDGCNAGGGHIKVDDQGIKFIRVMSTAVACLGPNEWVQRYFYDGINGQARYRLVESHLVLNRDGQTLVFSSD